MSTLLINGCSYTTNWSPLDKVLGKKLEFESTVNLSTPGSSNDRIFRTTLEYIFKNKVDFVMLSMTFWDRQEAYWADDDWTDYSPMGATRPAELKNDESMYKKYIQDRYRYDVDINYMDKLLNDIIMFTGWLDSMGIRYLIFSSPGEYFKWAKFTFNQDKLTYLKNNTRIIDIENWSANQYMHDHGGTSIEKEGSPANRHYTTKSFAILNEFIYEHITNNNL